MELITYPCPSPRCKRTVAKLLVTGQTGAHKEEVVDPEPVTWESGGRIKLLDHQPGTTAHPLARRLRQAGQAFASDGTLYRPHRDSCAGGTGRTAPRSREANG